MSLPRESEHASGIIVDSRHPWPGLVAFTEELRDFFHGRVEEEEELLRRVRSKNLTVLFGQSGLGKSSLLQAGLFPRLRSEGYLPVPIRLDHGTFAPTQSDQIKSAVIGAVMKAGGRIVENEANTETIWEFLHRRTLILQTPDDRSIRPVLVLDQFEEIFATGSSSRSRVSSFLRELADFAENRAPIALELRFDDRPELISLFDFDDRGYRILICLREDYLPQLERLRSEMPSICENRMRLMRMDGLRALDAVLVPGGSVISEEVGRKLVQFVGGGKSGPEDDPPGDDELAEVEIEPSLLSLLCCELNNRRLASGLPQITQNLLATTRDLILEDFYERCLGDQHPGVRAFIQNELVTDSGHRENVAMENAKRSLTSRGADPSAIGELVKRRLLHVEDRLNTKRVELIHDLLTVVVMKHRGESPEPGFRSSSDPSLMRALDDHETDRETLIDMWRAFQGQDAGWSDAPQVHAKFAERMLGFGEPLLAYDIVDSGLAKSPENVRLRRLMGLTLVRTGDLVRAESVLSDLQRQGHTDEETLELLARTYKEVGLQTLEEDEPKARAYLRRSLDLYSTVYKTSRSIWTGANAAALALILGNETNALELARNISIDGHEDLKRVEAVEGDPFWAKTVLGEAAIIMGDLAEAERHYVEAGNAAWSQLRFGDLSSARRQARLLARYRPGSREVVDRCLPSPAVTVCVGHMIDQPGRAWPRFPPELENPVRSAIREKIERTGTYIGFASAACGSDILFLEALIEMGRQAHVVLPCDSEQFFERSVAVLPGGTWGERFRRVLEQSEVTIASDRKIDFEGMSYIHAFTMREGLATLKAEQLEARLVHIAVWDGQPGDGPGGTASSVARWRSSGFGAEIIDLAEIAKAHGFATHPASETITTRPPVKEFPLSISHLVTSYAAILVADVVGFSRLSDEQLPNYVLHFLGLVADVLHSLPIQPMKKSTWGDSLFMVFGDVVDAGRFALQLRDRIVATPWQNYGLPSLNVRTALHSGLVYSCIDPVTERMNFIGGQVSHAARLEPITPPGRVFASEAFAATAAARGIHDFRCHYIGRVPHAKGYGVFPTYDVVRASPRSERPS